jgi:hypothetical protein
MPRPQGTHTPDTWTLPVGTEEVIEPHFAVLTIGGYAADPASTRAGTKAFAGVCLRGHDNTTGDDGIVEIGGKVERACIVDREGRWLFDLDPAAVPERNAPAYLVDREIVHSDGTGLVLCGRFIAPDVSGGWWVDIGV